jgi:hypothetical protein
LAKIVPLDRAGPSARIENEITHVPVAVDENVARTAPGTPHASQVAPPVVVEETGPTGIAYTSGEISTCPLPVTPAMETVNVAGAVVPTRML